MAALVIADVVTFTHPYPRNDIMFTAPLTIELDRLSAVAREWQTANYLRVFLVATAWLGIARALTAIVQQQSRTTS